MAMFSQKERRMFFNSKENTPGTRNTFEFFEGRSITADFPSVNYLKEMDIGKYGAGEHGTRSEVQAAFSPVSMKAQRLSEIAYLLGYVTGKADAVETVSAGVAYKHEFEHLPVTSRTLPTFSFQIGKQAASTCDSFLYTIMNDFSITLAAGGNGVIDSTFNGFSNLHYDSSGTLTRNATVDNSSFASNYNFNTEPLINFKCCKMWFGTLEATPLVQADISMTDHNMSSATEISSYINTVTFGMSNGLGADDLLRAGGCGVINNSERKDQSFTLEIALRKDGDFDAKALANTQQAFELQFVGPVIGSTYRYGMKWIWPVVQIGNIAQDQESPINETLPCEVFQDSSHMAFYCYAQNAVDQGMNTTISTSRSSSSSTNSSSSSSESSSSSS